MEVRSEYSFSTVFVLKSQVDLRTAWLSYFKRVGPCNLEKMCAIEMYFSVKLLGFVNTIDLGASPLTFYFEKQKSKPEAMTHVSSSTYMIKLQAF